MTQEGSFFDFVHMSVKWQTYFNDFSNMAEGVSSLMKNLVDLVIKKTTTVWGYMYVCYKFYSYVPSDSNIINQPQ